MSHITEAEAATRLGVSRRTLRRWRAAGRDVPAHARLHGRIVYDREDVEAWTTRQFTPRIAA
ncbi:helix-turn-helix domain-containing protein [Corynebacterium sp. HMSC14B06]|uniref:helix-turn-helix domain-containing protein n=1 Tax=Corynebacterium sp. HMSC14B06 TaxID=1581098 RepID=UPI0009F1F680|nr:helix-turn-helix domain-containing protein [Corynebacterium sp. HMSC14B06]